MGRRSLKTSDRGNAHAIARETVMNVCKIGEAVKAGGFSAGGGFPPAFWGGCRGWACLTPSSSSLRKFCKKKAADGLDTAEKWLTKET